MPDIIEENDGDGASAIARRARNLALARAAARAARAANPNNAVDALVERANANEEAPNPNQEVEEIATQVARLSGANVRPMLIRLGVRCSNDVKFIREKDLDGLIRTSPIEKRKMWAILKYISNDNPQITPQTTLREIAQTLNANKRREKESSSTTAAASTTTSSALVPVSKLEAFDGSHTKWLLWKNRTSHSLAQTCLAPLLEEASTAFAKKNPKLDGLFFHLLAEALVGGSAAHLIKESKEKTKDAQTNEAKPSGDLLWKMLTEYHSKGPMAFWILSDARQVLQNLHLVGSESNESQSKNSCVAYSAQDYVHRFRCARDTLSEFDQALPDQFLASTFVEHVHDERLESIKKQLMHDVSSKNLTLEDCIRELLMSDHLLRVRMFNKEKPRASRKRSRSEDETKEAEDAKRLKETDNGNKDRGEGENSTFEEPDEQHS